VLIFDETITGFRLALGGASELFGVTPDLAVYGKALAAGWPAAAVAGPTSLMSEFGTGRVGHFGTFNGNMVAMAAVTAGLDLLVNEPPYAAIEAEGTRLMAGLRELAAEHDISLHLQGYPMAFHMSMPSRARDIETFGQLQTTNRTQYGELWQSFLGHGIWIAKRGIWYLSAAHTGDVIDELLQRAAESMRSYRALTSASMAVGR
jgi:glutamate-1-semialdehyde 2,1-aminomutase